MPYDNFECYGQTNIIVCPFIDALFGLVDSI